MDVKNFILKLLASLAGLTFMISGCMIDSESWVPFIVCCVALVYLMTFVYANDFFRGNNRYGR